MVYLRYSLPHKLKRNVSHDTYSEFAVQHQSIVESDCCRLCTVERILNKLKRFICTIFPVKNKTMVRQSFASLFILIGILSACKWNRYDIFLGSKFIPKFRFIGNQDVTCQTDNPWDMVPEILKRISPPVIPDRVCNILDFGALRSPNADDVEAPSATVDANINAFRNSIQYCHDNGGGTVFVPSGTFITSAITLLSNISLEVSPGAIIRFTRDTTKYPIVFTRWEGNFERFDFE